MNMIVAYDIADPRRLIRVAKIMKDYGLRVQKSVFEVETDPVMIIKWKEVYDVLEVITDRCEDAANVIEGVVVKHG